jgi:hypothetical protein
MSMASSCSKRAIASLAFAADKIIQPRASMMDSARARTVGSSSTTRTVVGLAFLDFIRPTPFGSKGGNHRAKAKFHLSRLFCNCDCTCGTYAAKIGSPEAAIDYKLWPFGTSMAFPTMRIEPVNYSEAETDGNSTLTVVPRSCAMASVPLI